MVKKAPWSRGRQHSSALLAGQEEPAGSFQPWAAAGRGLPCGEAHLRAMVKAGSAGLHWRFEVLLLHLKQGTKFVCKPLLCVYAEVLQWKCSDPEKLEYSFFLNAFVGK